jgi:ABC-type nitrate/sulfonate/bicarbonate transport system substrate-binding protein
MIQALKNDELDLAFLLTESVAFAQMSGKTLYPLSVFVESPLEWGIFTGFDNPISQVEPIGQRKYAISRPGSGSQLMARVDAYRRQEHIKPEQWVVVQNLDGAEEALLTGKADLFFWEKWTTKPYVDQKKFRMVDVCRSPWPGFILVSGKELSKAQHEVVSNTMEEIFMLCKNLKEKAGSVSEIAREYGQRDQDTSIWLQQVSWPKGMTDPASAIKLAMGWMEKVN